MSQFAQLSSEERAPYLQEAAERLGVSQTIVEKDFWVCRMLGWVFQNPELGPHLVFKGGTSLSKVFGAIQRFSEDIDLSVSPALLGWNESDLDDAPSRTQRTKRMEDLQSRCVDQTEGVFRPAVEATVRASLGQMPDGGDWVTYQLDPTSNSPTLLFAYPSVLSHQSAYIASIVKLEFGSLTDQRPAGEHRIKPLLADVLPADDFDDLETTVTSLEIERTFWEKATILHSTFHRPGDQPIPDRYARHYADFAALWLHASKDIALARLDLLDRVATFKTRFFSSRSANYETARPGSLRLSPPTFRENELFKDYEKMRPMFLGEPPDFIAVLQIIREAEQHINSL